MEPVDPFDLVKRLGGAPLGPLVEALRRVHDHGTAHADPVWAVLGDQANRFASRDPTPPAGASPASSSPDYEAARQHFVRHSEKLREQAMLAEKLLDGLIRHAGAAPPVSLQQELRMQGSVGSKSSARFTVVNRLQGVAAVRFRPSHVHGLPADGSTPVGITFSPELPRLEPGAAVDVELTVDLPRRDDLPNPLEFGVDVLGDEQLLLKLWIQIELRSGVTAPATAAASAERSVHVELRDPEPTELVLLRSVQRLLLKHPVAGQALFTALVTEGRRFGATDEGRVWRQRLITSSLLQQARLVFDVATLGMLEERGDGDLPSSYLDALFMAASGGDVDAVLDRLFWAGNEKER